MSTRAYTLSGRVVDRATQAGVPSLVVEAWDRDTRFHDMLGSTITNADGSFAIHLTAEHFGDYGGDHAPDVFFRVYRDEQLIKTTFDEPHRNLPPGETRFVIELDLGSAPVGRDRVTAEQAFKAARFFHESDFRGVAREQRDKLKAGGNVIAALAKRTLASFDFEPVKPRGARTSDVVGQDSSTAIRNLATHDVAVVEVRSFDPRANRESLRTLTALPRKLKPEDKVVLYEENGIVRAYAIRKPVVSADVNANEVARIDSDLAVLKGNVTDLSRVRGDVDVLKETQERERSEIVSEVAAVKTRVDEVTKLEQQVVELRQASAAKDTQIAKLQEEVSAMRAAHAELVQRVSPERINQLEEHLRRLSEPSRPVGGAPAKTTRKKRKGR